jgi:hypothetical protein
MKIYARLNVNDMDELPQFFRSWHDAAVLNYPEPGAWTPCVGVDWTGMSWALDDSHPRSFLRQYNGCKGWQHSSANAVYVFEISVSS